MQRLWFLFVLVVGVGGECPDATPLGEMFQYISDSEYCQPESAGFDIVCSGCPDAVVVHAHAADFPEAFNRLILDSCTVVFVDEPMNLTLVAIEMSNNAQILSGTKSCPRTQPLLFNFKTVEAISVGTFHGVRVSSGMHVSSSAIEIYGTDWGDRAQWTPVAQGTHENASVRVDDATVFKVGDEIVITGTGWVEEVAELTVEKVDGDILTFDRPVGFLSGKGASPPPYGIAGHVALLSRAVEFRGDPAIHSRPVLSLWFQSYVLLSGVSLRHFGSSSGSETLTSAVDVKPGSQLELDRVIIRDSYHCVVVNGDLGSSSTRVRITQSIGYNIKGSCWMVMAGKGAEVFLQDLMTIRVLPLGTGESAYGMDAFASALYLESPAAVLGTHHALSAGRGLHVAGNYFDEAAAPGPVPAGDGKFIAAWVETGVFVGGFSTYTDRIWYFPHYNDTIEGDSFNSRYLEVRGVSVYRAGRAFHNRGIRLNIVSPVVSACRVAFSVRNSFVIGGFVYFVSGKGTAQDAPETGPSPQSAPRTSASNGQGTDALARQTDVSADVQQTGKSRWVHLLADAQSSLPPGNSPCGVVPPPALSRNDIRGVTFVTTHSNTTSADAASPMTASVLCGAPSVDCAGLTVFDDCSMHPAAAVDRRVATLTPQKDSPLSRLCTTVYFGNSTTLYPSMNLPEFTILPVVPNHGTWWSTCSSCTPLADTEYQICTDSLEPATVSFTSGGLFEPGLDCGEACVLGTMRLFGKETDPGYLAGTPPPAVNITRNSVWAGPAGMGWHVLFAAGPPATFTVAALQVPSMVLLAVVLPEGTNVSVKAPGGVELRNAGGTECSGVDCYKVVDDTLYLRVYNQITYTVDVGCLTHIAQPVGGGLKYAACAPPVSRTHPLAEMDTKCADVSPEMIPGRFGRQHIFCDPDAPENGPNLVCVENTDNHSTCNYDRMEDTVQDCAAACDAPACQTFNYHNTSLVCILFSSRACAAPTFLSLSGWTYFSPHFEPTDAPSLSPATQPPITLPPQTDRPSLAPRTQPPTTLSPQTDPPSSPSLAPRTEAPSSLSPQRSSPPAPSVPTDPPAERFPPLAIVGVVAFVLLVVGVAFCCCCALRAARASSPGEALLQEPPDISPDARHSEFNPTRWFLEDVLGRGAFATVYRGRCTVTGDVFAVKVIALPYSKGSQSRATGNTSSIGAETAKGSLRSKKTETDDDEEVEMTEHDGSRSRSPSFRVSTEPNSSAASGRKTAAKCEWGSFEAEMREIELFRSLQHPNIVQYHSAEVADDHLCIIMELLPNGSVGALVRSIGGLPVERAKRYTAQMLSGIAFLHDHRIMHRDIKGENLLLAADDTLKVSDFGCSKFIAEMQMTAANTVVGTPRWMAPEVITSPEQGYLLKADIWSAGCTACEMLTGQPPWPDFANALATMLHIAHSDPVIPPGVDPAASAFLHKLLQKVPTARPTAEEAAHDSWLCTVPDTVLLS
ncbi:Mitogen-activated protein kinase kinase kinase 2 [Diplonema papillatum]|nr:Mitogen-activated protein kinase kinase kinase 2 [Diplonema papillatum]